MGRNAEMRTNPGQSRIDPRSPDFLSSHPATPERIKNAQANARQFSGQGGERDRASYLAGIEGMVYGEDPSEGFVRGRRFLHAKLGFTFLAPEGFVLDNTAQAVLGVKEGGGQALRVDVVAVPAETQAHRISHVRLDREHRSQEHRRADDQRLPIGDGDREGRPVVVPALRGAVRQRGLSLHLRQQEACPRTSIVRSASRSDSFRRMTVAESQAARPLRIKVVTVAPGDTVERLAKSMAIADRPLERFRILNGLAPGQRVNPGDQVKIAVE